MAPLHTDSMFSLKIDNVPLETSSDELKEVFSKFGDIGDVYILRDSGKPSGYAFVRFMTKRDAEDAIKDMEVVDYLGRDLHVGFARPRGPVDTRKSYSRDTERGFGGCDSEIDRYNDHRRDQDRSSYHDRSRSSRDAHGRSRGRTRHHASASPPPRRY